MSVAADIQYRSVLISNGFKFGRSESSRAVIPAKCGVALDVHGTGRQVRLDCPFGCPGDHAGHRELSVDTSNPQKVFACHAYGCQVRGNLLTLMHGWLTNQLPPGGKLAAPLITMASSRFTESSSGDPPMSPVP